MIKEVYVFATFILIMFTRVLPGSKNLQGVKNYSH